MKRNIRIISLLHLFVFIIPHLNATAEPSVRNAGTTYDAAAVKAALLRPTAADWQLLADVLDPLPWALPFRKSIRPKSSPDTPIN